MLFLSLLGCSPMFGTWMFTKAVTLPTGDECIDDVIHDFVGAYEPIEVGEDPSWTEEDTGELSPEVLFGRVEQTGEGAVLIVGTAALPGERTDAGDWLFYWTNSESGDEGLTHVTGYQYTHTYESTATLRVEGAFDGDTFAGTWESESSAYDQWTESDTWSDEAGATVGEHGEIPSADYLLRINANTSVEEPATNGQLDYDCGEAGCTLTVSESCAYRYDLTGVATDLTPEDAGWAEDAGEAAGN